MLAASTKTIAWGVYVAPGEPKPTIPDAAVQRTILDQCNANGWWIESVGALHDRGPLAIRDPDTGEHTSDLYQRYALVEVLDVVSA